MKVIKLLICALLILLTNLNADAEKRKILFIGNSYIAVNDLPTVVKNLALSFGDTLEIDSNTPGGMNLNGHTTNPTTLSKIQAGGWDYVVIQAQSQEPSFDPTQVAVDTYPYAKKLDSLVHVSNPCAETIFYMTWGRKNGDAGNCPFYPPVCTYEGMQQRLRESYLEMSMTNDATCSPVGVAWKKVRDTNPGIELYNPDQSHPSLSGTYLVACTFYSTIYHKPSTGSTYVLGGVLPADALTLQTIAGNTVLDSLENWQQYGSLPKATFSKTNISNQYSFTNQSTRSTQYEWNFGDGSAVSTQTSPNHTYISNGNYEVILKSKNACGKYDLFRDSIHVSSLPSAVGDVERKSVIVSYSNEMLTVLNAGNADQIGLYAMSGSLVRIEKIKEGTQRISLNRMSKGIYFYSVSSGSRVISNGRFEIR